MRTHIFLLALLCALFLAVPCLAQQVQIPTTLDHFFLAGSQPGQSGQLETPDRCDNCHGGYDRSVEPAFNWRGSMMSQAARDPFFYACLTIANQDAAFAGDLCIRCHTPAGWLEGRSLPTDGSALNNNDREGVQCDFCHKLVAPSGLGSNPFPGDQDYLNMTYQQDQGYLALLTPIPSTAGSGMYVVDADNGKRGPLVNPAARHQYWYSPFHKQSAFCGTCHDVSNPVFVKQPNGSYAPNLSGTTHPTGNPSDMFPVERTYSEWRMSAFNDPEDPTTCQDCHMRSVTGAAANKKNAPIRTLALHDMTGGNTWVPDIIGQFWPGEVDQAALDAGKQRALGMLRQAATLAVTEELSPVTITVTNLTGHKLPSGYPEGRRVFLTLVFMDENGQSIQEINSYDAVGAAFRDGGIYSVEKDLIFEAKLGMSEAVTTATGLSNDADGSSFHFAVNNVVVKDNRIPPEGFTNANFLQIQAEHVPANLYADGQHWFTQTRPSPAGTANIRVELYYQITSPEYITFLRDENRTNNWGIDLYNAWLASGKAAPVLMESYDSAGDTQPPTAPSQLTANAPKFNAVDLTWSPSVDNVAVAGYYIYRTDLGTVPIADVTGTSYSDNSVDPESTYSYYVKAYDAAANLSAASNTATATTPAKKGGGKPKPKTVQRSDELPRTANLLLYPTMARDNLHLDWDIPAASQVRVEVYSTLGACLLSRDLGAHDAGSYTSTLPLAGLPAGVYLLRLGGSATNATTSVVRRFVIVH